MTIRREEFGELKVVTKEDDKKLIAQERKETHSKKAKEWRECNTEKNKEAQRRWCCSENGKLSRSKAGSKNHAKRKRNLGFEPINEHFEGGVWHHINENDVICMPEELHRSVYHVLATGVGMEEINDLAMEFMLAELGEC